MEKKLLLLATVVALSGAGALLPMTVHGATVADLQAQLTALLAQVAALQAQLASGTSVSTGTVPASLLSSGDLTVGKKGVAVMDLQKFLNANGAQITAIGAGSPGNETEFFGSLTKLALAKWQEANGISPAAGYFGVMTRKKLTAMGKVAEQPTVTPPEAVVSVPETVVATTTPAPVVSLPNPFQSTLVFETTYPSGTLNSNSGDKILTEFKLKATEKIAVSKIRFTSVGTVQDNKLINLRLFNSQTNEVLATVDDPVDRIIDFKMTPDSSKTDKGLMVSGKTYYVMAMLITLNVGDVKPHIKLDIASVSDISAFDYDDLTRVADISKTNVFPIEGPKITSR